MNALSIGDNRRLAAFIRKIPDLTNSQRSCLMYFKALYIRHGARALHPSIETIARRCHISTRQAQRAMAELRKRGFLKLVAHEGGGNGHARHYAFVELAVLSAGYKGRHFDAEMSPFRPPINRDKMSPDKYTHESIVVSIADDTAWATERIKILLKEIGV